MFVLPDSENNEMAFIEADPISRVRNPRHGRFQYSVPHAIFSNSSTSMVLNFTDNQTLADELAKKV
ncbi:unnamed protein product [Rodentolepis nana]|uniref:SERPIN domain-containing protein n=1 Tax=Rodentolepis nana TaxID=102285 RepID=A0A0R3T9P6_RODNA|nr:unnamed protein product [Rodentolepis nana]